MSTIASQRLLDYATPLPLGRPAWRPNPWLVAITVTLATFMEVLDTSIANVALPHIAGSLSAGQDESTWVLTSYLVANAIVLPLSGWFSSVLGRKRFYMICVATFTLASVLCGLATSLPMLIAFRVLQGFSGGGLQPTEQSILADTFPPARRGMAFAVYGIAVVTAPALGPTLGGWITDNYSWHWIFFINLPVGILSLVLTNLLVQDPPSPTDAREKRTKTTKTRIDYLGIGLIALGLGALEVAIDKGQREDWFQSRYIVAAFVVAGAALVATVWRSLRQKEPIVEFRLLANRNLAVAFALLFMLGFVLMGSTVLLPLLLQTQLGYTATLAGEALTPGALVIMALMPLVGFLLGRVQARYLIVGGLVVGAVGLWLMTGFSLDLDFRTAVWARIVLCAGLAFLFVPINTASYANLPPGKNNAASGLLNLARNIGGSVGIAFSMTMLERRAQLHQTVLAAHATPFDPQYVERVRQVTQTLLDHGASAAAAANQAAGMIYSTVLKQATMLAFLDNFRIMAAVFLAIIPLVFLMRKNKPAKGELAVH